MFVRSSGDAEVSKLREERHIMSVAPAGLEKRKGAARAINIPLLTELQTHVLFRHA